MWLGLPGLSLAWPLVAQWQTRQNTGFFQCPLLVGLQTLAHRNGLGSKARPELVDLIE